MTDKQLFYEELVREVKEDFAARREMRRPYELTWQLNMNFLMGNQFCNITGRGEIEQDEKYFFWQEREAYNHIAPIIETRVAKLDRVRPAIKVMPLLFNLFISFCFSFKKFFSILKSPFIFLVFPCFFLFILLFYYYVYA